MTCIFELVSLDIFYGLSVYLIFGLVKVGHIVMSSPVKDADAHIKK